MDIWVEYWLSHIQIDIDTLLAPKEIENLVLLIFGPKIKPFKIDIEGITYIIRC